MAPQSSQQAQQAALVSLIAQPLDAAWQLLDISDLNTSLPKFTALIAAIVQQYGRAAATLAARQYVAERTTAGIAGTFTVKPAKPAGLEQVGKSVGWATKGLWSETPDTEAARTLVSGVTEKAILDTGRNTVFQAVKSDRKAEGWAREVEPGACSFCLLLATRGAAYKSEQTASFRSHDHCRCIAVPVFSKFFEPTLEVRQAQDIYREVTRGKSGAEARLAFRQAIEARSSLSSPVLEPATT